MSIRAPIQYVTVVASMLLLAAAALGYFTVPTSMLAIVGIEATLQTEFLIRTLAAAFLSMLPGAWTARRGYDPARRVIIFGLAIYMFASSVVDGWAYLDRLVGAAAIPSIAFRSVLGLILAWLAVSQPVGHAE